MIRRPRVVRHSSVPLDLAPNRRSRGSVRRTSRQSELAWRCRGDGFRLEAQARIKNTIGQNCFYDWVPTRDGGGRAAGCVLLWPSSPGIRTAFLRPQRPLVVARMPDFAAENDALQVGRVIRWGQLEPPPAERPVSGLRPDQVVSQLIYRVFGPERSDVEPLLDLHGLAGQPATHIANTSSRNGISEATLRQAERQLRAEARRTAIPSAIMTEASRPTTAFEDHVARRRVAKTLGAEDPPPWRRSHTDALAVRTCIGVLAIVSPLTLTSLARAVGRTRRWSGLPVPSDALLALLLIESGAVNRRLDGRWQLLAPQRERHSYRLLADAFGADVLTRSECSQLLLRLGYAASSVDSLSLDRHPMIERIGPSQYTLIGNSERGRPKQEQ